MKNRKPPKIDPAMVTGIAWYREEDWPRIKALFPDAGASHDSYAQWLQAAGDMLERLRSEGIAAEPYVLDIDDFLGWCLIHGRKRVAADRSAYVAEKLRLRKGRD